MSIIWTDLNPATATASADILCLVDVSDSSQSPEGSSKQYTQAVFFNRGTITADDPFVFTQTWNNAAVAFSGYEFHVTDTASLIGSTVFAITLNSDTPFAIARDGTITLDTDVTVTGTITGDLTGNVTGNVTGTLTGNVTGSITSNAWVGTAIDATHGGTAQTSWTTGDILYASGANTLAKRGIGSSGDVLTVSGGVPVWQALPAASSTFTTNIQTTLTTEQLRLRYDASNYATVTVSSVGNTVIDLQGTPTTFQISLSGSVIVGVGTTGLSMANSTALITAASVAARAGLQIPHGTAPSSPVNGDMWSSTSGLFIRINGVTKTVTLT